jgi:hypothetical protein
MGGVENNTENTDLVGEVSQSRHDAVYTHFQQQRILNFWLSWLDMATETRRAVTIGATGTVTSTRPWIWDYFVLELDRRGAG